MQGIENWKRKVRARRSRDRDWVSWDGMRSAWFNRFAGQSDRSSTYRFMAPHVRGQVLEVGPGPGAYTRLLVQAASRVVAVEPSPHMARLLRQNLGPCSNLEIVESTIEEYLDRLEEYDFALAANVLEGIERIDEVIGGIAARARVFSIGTWANAVTPDWSRAVQAEVLGQAVGPDAPDNADLLAVLDDLGLEYQVHVPGASARGFASRDDLLAWVEGFMELGPARREELARVLEPFIAERDGRFILPRGQESWIVNVRKPGTCVSGG